MQIPVQGIPAWSAALQLLGIPAAKARDWAGKMLRDGYAQGAKRPMSAVEQYLRALERLESERPEIAARVKSGDMHVA